MNSSYAILAAGVIVVVGAMAIWGLSGVEAPLPIDATNPLATSTDDAPRTTAVRIALLDTAGTSDGPSRGCDRVVFAERHVPATGAVLNAALAALFAEEDEQTDGAFNFIARTNDTLAFSHAVIEEGTAKIYLTGSLSGLAGVCDDPRAQIQIEETALQFPTVKRVEIYLNGTKTNLTPSQR